MSVLSDIAKSILFLKNDRLSKKDGGAVKGDVDFTGKLTKNGESVINNKQISYVPMTSFSSVINVNSSVITFPFFKNKIKYTDENLFIVKDDNSLLVNRNGVFKISIDFRGAFEKEDSTAYMTMYLYKNGISVADWLVDGRSSKFVANFPTFIFDGVAEDQIQIMFAPKNMSFTLTQAAVILEKIS